MNKRQKEVQAVQLNDEQRTIRELKQVYKKASEDCAEKIRQLSARTDLENLQTIVYQRQYQEALKKQIDGVLDTLNGESFTTVASFLEKSYDNGFFGTLYDLQGQGIPLIFPIDQGQVAAAIQTDSKISQGLYQRMGEDTNRLKNSIRAELSRGAANGESWNQIAAHIATGMTSPFSKAYNRTVTIARTEGHRIQQEATYHCQQKAKGKGADVVKQWDSTLDGNTRPWHMDADGQIAEVDEPFEVMGERLMYPSDPAGSAKNVINCRCCSLQRAKWALSDEEYYTKWNGDKDELVTVKAKTYDDFRKKADDVIKTVQAAKNPVKLEASDFPAAFNARGESKITQRLIDYVNNQENADQKVVRLYKSMGKLDTITTSVPFKITHGKNHAVRTQKYTMSGKLADVQLVIPKLVGDNIAGQVNTTLHEEMHLMDLMARKGDDWFSTTRKGLRDIFSNKTTDMSDEIKNLFNEHKVELEKVRGEIKAAYKTKISAVTDKYFPQGTSMWSAPYNTYKEYQKEVKKLQTAMSDEIDYASRNIMGGGVGNLEDIYDALSYGTLRGNGVRYGHGATYYARLDNRIEETIANYAALSITRPDLIEMLAADKPDLVNELDELVEALLKEVENK